MSRILNLLDEIDVQGYDITQKSKNIYYAKSPKGDEYKLTKTPQGNITCTCIGYKYNNKCKHQAMVKEAYPKEFEEKVRHPMEKMPLDLMHKIFDKYDPDWTLLGSGRRNGKKPGADFKDIDMLVDVDVETFKKIVQELEQNPNFEKIVAGDDIFRGYLNGYELDVNRVNPKKQGKGAMLLYRTGPKDLNVLMRIVAIKNGWALSEKGLIDHLTGEYIVPPDAPEEVYFEKLGMRYLPPEERQDFQKYLGTADDYPQKYRPSKETISKIADEYEKDIKAGKFRNTSSVLADRAKRTGFVSPTSYEQKLGYEEVMRRLRGKVKEDPSSHIITYLGDREENTDGQQSLFQSELREFDINIAESVVSALIELGVQSATVAALGYASQKIPMVKNAIAKVLKKFSRTHDEEEAQKELEVIKKSVKEELVDDIIKLGKELGKDYKREDLSPKGVKQLFAIKHSVSDRVEKARMNESYNTQVRNYLTEARSSAELKQLLQDFGVDPSEMSIKQMQQELFSQYWKKEHPGEPEPDQYDPMLAHEIKGMSPEEIKSVFTADKYIAQEKHDRVKEYNFYSS